jgi:putative DNA primase/helicase
VFTSGRVKIIPFDRHFTAEEQDTGLKKFFRRRESKSAILNWLVEGCRLLRDAGFTAPARVDAAIEAYRSEADIIGIFLSECTEAAEGGRIPTTDLYALYADWAKANGYKPLSNRAFTIDIRRRYEIRRTGPDGRVVIGIAVKS